MAAASSTHLVRMFFADQSEHGELSKRFEELVRTLSSFVTPNIHETGPLRSHSPDHYICNIEHSTGHDM